MTDLTSTVVDILSSTMLAMQEAANTAAPVVQEAAPAAAPAAEPAAQGVGRARELQYQRDAR